MLAKGISDKSMTNDVINGTLTMVDGSPKMILHNSLIKIIICFMTTFVMYIYNTNNLCIS